MIHNNFRNGNFTSSEIVKLTIMGKRDMTEKELSELARRQAMAKSVD